jgi:FAD:protein FMN transferase
MVADLLGGAYDLHGRREDRPHREWFSETRKLYYQIPVTVRFYPYQAELGRRVWSALAAIDDEFNDYRDSSEIGTINCKGPGVFHLSTALTDAFTLADRMRGPCHGLCEPSMGVCRRLWKGAAASGVLPTPEQLTAARSCVGPHTYRHRDGQLQVLVAGTAFDFGGICKGMAVDRAVNLLRTAGCPAALVQVGGESCCWGMSPQGRPHRLAIPNPDEPDQAQSAWARIVDPGGGMCGSTSGNYRLPVVVAGQALYHIYDPRTCLPADTRHLSFSVVLPGTGRNGEADILTKTGILLGSEALTLVQHLGGEALLLQRIADGSIQAVQTTGWSRLCFT